MKRVRIDNSVETLILTGMIVSDRFLRDVRSIFDIRLIESGYVRRVCRWCLDYFEEHARAPKVHIQDIYNDEMEAEKIDADEGQMIARVLQRVSREYERSDQFNVGYLLKKAEKYFQGADYKRLSEDLARISEDNPNEAIELLNNYRHRILPSSDFVEVFRNKDLMMRSYEDNITPLFKLSGDLGRMINGDLCRGSFISLMGHEKIGKTWNLSDLAFRAAENRLNVAFFQAGDMTDAQQARRFGIRLTGRSNRPKYCGDILVPIFDCVHNQNDTCDLKKRCSEFGLTHDENRVEKINHSEDFFKLMTSHREKAELFRINQTEGYRACDYCRRRHTYNYKGSLWYEQRNVEPSTWREAYKASRKFLRRMKGRRFFLSSHSNNSLTIGMIKAILDNWANYQNFTPDVILIDYADILVAENTHQDYRHQQNEIWKGLRSLSQDFDCLLITATQANAAAYSVKTLGLQNFSEDKRKYAHVTTMIGLNQTAEEKVAGAMRWNILLSRDEDFNQDRTATTLQCFNIGRANMGSFFD